MSTATKAGIEPSAFEILSLSQGYATAESYAERTLYLAAGEAQIATYPIEPV
jgi:hypothetical protein